MLVGGVIVEDDVDHFAGRHLGLDRVEEADELLMAMALHVAADDSTFEDIERGEKGRGAMALVVVGHGAEPPLLQGQARLGAVKGLDLRFLIERQHDGMGWRIDIEPDHVAQFGDEVRIVRELELPIAVRLKPVRFPDAPNRAGADAARPRHQIGRPVGRLGRRIGERQRHHALGHLRAERGDARGPRLVAQEAVDAFLHEPFLPAPDTSLRLAGPTHDVVGADAIGAEQYDGRAPNVFLRGVAVSGHRFEAAANGPRDRDGNPGAHAPDSHANRTSGL